MAFNATRKVIVLGSINMDLVVTAERIPEPGETLLGHSFNTMHGGKGANQAVAAARAGADVTMIGRLGPDAFGDQLRAGLVEESIDVTHVGTCKHDPSGVALITVADDGENSIVVASGANAMVRTVHVDDAMAAGVFASDNILLMQLEVPIDVVQHAARLHKGVGGTVVINAAPAVELSQDMWAYVDVLIVNANECETLGGAETMSQLVPTLIVTLGADGLDVHHDGEHTTIGALDVDVVDSTGAGDAFCGYFVSELSQGASVGDAAALANIAAGMSVTKLGARTSPTTAEVEAFISE
jgi:ribokinase